MMSLAVALSAMMSAPSMPIKPQRHACVVDEFVDDSRYPSSEEDYAEQNLQMKVSIVDAGDRIIVETTLPSSETQRHQLSVTDRTPDKIVAQAEGEQSPYALRLQAEMIGPEAAAQVSGSLIYQTYEVDHTWRLSCTAAIDP